VVRAYQAFARREARGRSAAYQALAEPVAADPALVAFIASLPPAKRQPQLIFAAARTCWAPRRRSHNCAV
jgi:hypothetical protein